MPIKNIIFDLGGVLLDINYGATIKAFQDIGMANPEQAFSQEIQADLFQTYEKGEIASDIFIEKIKDSLPSSATKDAVLIRQAWCAMLGQIKPGIYEILEALSAKGIKLFILSNTNEIHQTQFEHQIEQRYGWQNFRLLFTDIYYSHHLRMRKPDHDIFMAVLKKNKLVAEECLFIDDTKMHVTSATELGIDAYHLQPKEHLGGILKNFF